MERNFESDKKLIESEQKGVVQVLKSEKDSLKANNNMLTSQVTDLTAKLENAYNQLRDLASDTVKGPSMAAMVSEIKKQQQNSNTR